MCFSQQLVRLKNCSSSIWSIWFPQNDSSMCLVVSVTLASLTLFLFCLYLHLCPGLIASIVYLLLHIWQGYLTFSYYFVFDRIVSVLVTFFQWRHFVTLIIRNLNLISVQSWTYLSIFNRFTPGAFCQKCVFWTFWWFSGWISAKLALIWWKMHLQHNSLPFLWLELRLFDIWARAYAEIKILRLWTRKWPRPLGFSILICFLPFLLFVLQWSTFYWACLQLKKLLGDGQFLSWSSQV